MEVVVRHKRQITLPRDVCDRLGIGPGDSLEITLKDSVLTARPKKAIALDALAEIQRMFQQSGIAEKELMAAGRRARREILRRRNAAQS